jgi:Rrf2 family protein
LIHEVEMEGALRISEAASLALHAMSYIAARGGSGPVPVPALSAALGASEAHLGKVLQRLARLGFLESRRGPRGGYSMGRDARELTLLEIYEAVDGPLHLTTCLLERRACGQSCIFGGLLESVDRQVREHLTHTRLSDVSFEPNGRGKGTPRRSDS